jgi:peroxiredoxin Q/BCP
MKFRCIEHIVIMLLLLPAIALLFCSCSYAGPLKEGDKAPDFSLKSQDGLEVKLSDRLKQGFVVLYFYPKDDTPGCKKQACSFRDAGEVYRAAGAEIIGVSVDTVDSHKQFHQKYNLGFTILADPDKKVTELYGVKSALGLAQRVTFVIDGTGVIRKIYPDVDVSTHAQDVLSFLQAAKPR